MKATELIRWALKLTDGGYNAMLEGMHDAALVQPSEKGGNHAMWLTGHLAFIEGNVMKILLGEPNPVQHWATLFETGSKPTTNAGDYPRFDEVLEAYRKGRARTLKKLDETGEGGLDRVPDKIPPGFEDGMKTVGHTFMLLALHHMVHYGQLANARRAAGLKPLI